MIVLDTNVVSEMMRAVPNPGVLAWLDGLDRAEVRLTSVTLAEVWYGIERLSNGRRKRALALALEEMVGADFAGRILPFGVTAARHFGAIVAVRDASGRPIATTDAQIAAICASTGAAVATRNVVDFAACGVEVVDPWGR